MIAIASDHAAVNFKQKIKEHLMSNGIEVFDVGTNSDIAVDYPDFAAKACKTVLSGKCEKAILICGTGIGMCISANKIKGIRCALCSDTFSARLTRQHNDANVLALGERVLGIGLAIDIVDAFLSNDFSNEPRHISRINKINGLENEEEKKCND